MPEGPGARLEIGKWGLKIRGCEDDEGMQTIFAAARYHYHCHQLTWPVIRPEQCRGIWCVRREIRRLARPFAASERWHELRCEVSKGWRRGCAMPLSYGVSE